MTKTALWCDLDCVRTVLPVQLSLLSSDVPLVQQGGVHQYGLPSRGLQQQLGGGECEGWQQQQHGADQHGDERQTGSSTTGRSPRGTESYMTL